MPSTILLDIIAWDLVLDSSGNIAAADPPYALAQDAASAIKTFLGECYFDTSVGVPYMTAILGKTPPLALLKQTLVTAAQTVPGVDPGSVKCFISSITGREVAGQVQVAASTGITAAANFVVMNPQGVG
jgi:hypothetical protein